MSINPLLLTDVYKCGHMRQYAPGTDKVYSYLIPRKNDKIPKVLFFGLQYYLKKYLSIKITQEHANEFFEYYKMILGIDPPQDVVEKINQLVLDGHFSLRIKAVPEGTVLPAKNVLVTVTNTKPSAYWQVGFIESLLLKVWNTCTVASYSKQLKNIAKHFSDATCDNENHMPFAVIDFGYRGSSSEETAQLSGAAHLINFLGTDTIPAVKFLSEYYNADKAKPIGLSVFATEHSVAQSYGKENEFDYIVRMLDLCPNGILSLVSDTYDLWNLITNYLPRLKDRILARDGKLVVRPDSGDPINIICGNPKADLGSPEYKGCLELLGEIFGYTLNNKGYKVLNQKIGLIYGDGFYMDRFINCYRTMEQKGWATSNLVIGMGGLLLQNHNRDEQGYAFKALWSSVNGAPRELFKNPITDPGKKSHKGLVALIKENGNYFTIDQLNWQEEQMGELKVVFEDGKILKEFTLDEIRSLANDA